MLINLRNALMAGKRLPYDAEVEYLESSGTQYIDTGIKPGPNTRVEITFAMTTFTANCGLFGARGNTTSSDNSYNLFIISNSGARVRWDWSGSGQYKTSEAETSTDATYVLGAAGGNITRNGTTVMSVSASKAAINYPLYVFNFNNVGTPYSTGANARFWSVKIYDGQTLVFDAIPVRKKTVGYLYDRVSGKLFGNAGTGAFVLGPDVVPVEYIESHGTEWIDTGVMPTASNIMVADFKFNDSTANQISGVWGSSGRFQFGIASGRFSIGLGSTGFDAGVSDTGRHRYTIDSPNNMVMFDDSAQTSASIQKTFLSYAIPIFVQKDDIGRQTNFCIGRLYSYKIYSGNSPLRSYRPVRVGSGSTWEGAMMDVLTRRIYRNQGTGAFGYGNDLKYPIPAE